MKEGVGLAQVRGWGVVGHFLRAPTELSGRTGTARVKLAVWEGLEALQGSLLLLPALGWIPAALHLLVFPTPAQAPTHPSQHSGLSIPTPAAPKGSRV